MRTWVISIFVALVLVICTTWLLSSMVRSGTQTPPLTSISMVEMATEQDNTLCSKEEKQKTDRIIAESSFCEDDSDCTIISAQCPLSCYIAVNVSKVKTVQRATTEFAQFHKQACGWECMRRCLPVAVTCRNQKCETILNLKKPPPPPGEPPAPKYEGST